MNDVVDIKKDCCLSCLQLLKMFEQVVGEKRKTARHLSAEPSWVGSEGFEPPTLCL